MPHQTYVLVKNRVTYTGVCLCEKSYDHPKRCDGCGEAITGAGVVTEAGVFHVDCPRLT